MERIRLHLHLGDYFRHTIHLNTTAHGAYFLLICHYYVHGKLPDDEDEIRLVTKLDRQRWQKYKPILQSFFRDGWKHKRIDEEIEAAKKLSEVKRANVAARYGGNGANPLADHGADPTAVTQPSAFFRKKEKKREPTGRKQASKITQAEINRLRTEAASGEAWAAARLRQLGLEVEP